MKDGADPMHPDWRTALNQANAAPRCHARSKRTGEPCQAPAVTGWQVCRMHGAGGGHPAGPAHPRWVHGLRSQEWTETRKAINDLAREAREIEALIGEGTKA
ncbi:hypothetical protein [Rubellimicrobium roseum]|uniref:Uncharacterized protein n=1 Tax=Rubellimicrobium roseum TaxID=687525 RepID=A0A5C4N3T9_9RHOB|nr:hypothetical protein [Rubellimicrobium roseum]TNC61189.1 hypothetical protein FHG71_21410 [Rubellimicrobium roseum]